MDTYHRLSDTTMDTLTDALEALIEEIPPEDADRAGGYEVEYSVRRSLAVCVCQRESS